MTKWFSFITIPAIIGKVFFSMSVNIKQKTSVKNQALYVNIIVDIKRLIFHTGFLLHNSSMFRAALPPHRLVGHVLALLGTCTATQIPCAGVKDILFRGNEMLVYF